jgi:hypothetical protein
MTRQGVSSFIPTASGSRQVGENHAFVSDKPTQSSVYPVFIEPTKTTAMQGFDFSHWSERLAQAPLSERHKQSYLITLRWYLSFCRRGRA